MSTAPCVSVDAPVRAVAAELRHGQLHTIAVLDESGLLAGFISKSDLLENGAADEHCLLRGGGRAGLHAGDVMAKSMATVSPDTPVWQVLALLETLGVDQVTVAEGRRLLGVVNRDRALSALCDEAGPPRHHTNT